jgi:hypothetical protein
MNDLLIAMFIGGGLVYCGYYIGKSRMTYTLSEEFISKRVVHRVMQMFSELNENKIIDIKKVNEFYQNKQRDQDSITPK